MAQTKQELALKKKAYYEKNKHWLNAKRRVKNKKPKEPIIIKQHFQKTITLNLKTKLGEQIIIEANRKKVEPSFIVQQILNKYFNN